MSLPSATKCPNCSREITELQDACVLEALATVLRDRGHSEERVLRLLDEVNVDQLWNQLGKIVDDLEVLLELVS